MSNPSTWETTEKEPGFEASLSDIVRPCLGNSEKIIKQREKRTKDTASFQNPLGIMVPSITQLTFCNTDGFFFLRLREVRFQNIQHRTGDEDQWSSTCTRS